MNRKVTIALLLGLSLAPNASAGVADCVRWLLGGGTAPTVEETTGLLPHDQAHLRDIRTLPRDERKEALKAYSTPKPNRWLNRAVVFADWMMASALGVGVLAGFREDPHAILGALALTPPVLFVADFLSQVIHKFLDSYGSERNAVWGATVRDFRKHHEDPNNLNDVGYIDTLGAPGLSLMPLFAAAALYSQLSPDLSPELGAAVWVFLMSSLHATECHKQAHLKKPNAVFAALQKARLTLGHEPHMAHHRPPFDENYAVINGWSNPLLRRLDLWNRLDKLYWRVRGRLPHNWVQDPRSIPPEVVRELEADLSRIPPELWATGDTYPARVPAPFRASLERARRKWQVAFIAGRRALYRERAEEDREAAEREWYEEQLRYPWLYGPGRVPLEEGVGKDGS